RVTLLLFIRVYRFENVHKSDFVLKKFISWNKHLMKNNSESSQPTHLATQETDSKKSDHMCYKNEPVVVLEHCISCSAFERNAMKAVYCQETGYYDRVNCTYSKQLGLRPCYNKTKHSIQFFAFTIFCAFLFVISYGVINWRQNVLRKRAYMRIRNRLNS
ncbi:unnamed protein product, partial [Thelazia callipaeda]|uniref:Protein JTB n=1 Tax=Thelazia callipaeda TaxID=103827 RepID=A0A0N5D9J0_THECL